MALKTPCQSQQPRLLLWRNSNPKPVATSRIDIFGVHLEYTFVSCGCKCPVLYPSRRCPQSDIVQPPDPDWIMQSGQFSDKCRLIWKSFNSATLCSVLPALDLEKVSCNGRIFLCLGGVCLCLLLDQKLNGNIYSFRPSLHPDHPVLPSGQLSCHRGLARLTATTWRHLEGPARPHCRNSA